MQFGIEYNNLPGAIHSKNNNHKRSSLYFLKQKQITHQTTLGQSPDILQQNIMISQGGELYAK